MASRRQQAGPARVQPRLTIVTPRVADVSGFADQLAAAIAVTEVAVVVLCLSEADERTLVNRIKALAPLVQGCGVALLLNGYPELVGRSGADGAHLTGFAALKDALPGLKPERIAGAGGLQTRHDAMLAAEAGADYVMFGEPDNAGRRPSFDAIVERVAWWAEVFEVPCVAYAASLDEVEPLAAVGAEFVAIGEFAFTDPRGPAASVIDAAARLAETVA